MTPPFSVVLPVYDGEEPEHFRTALDSVFRQTTPPDELLVVEHGPLTDELNAVVESFRKKHPDSLTVERVHPNLAFGEVCRAGVRRSSHDLVARMDADDIAHPDRFRRQLQFLEDESEVDLVGGHLAEFHTDPDEVHAVRRVPTDPDAIASRAQYANPINHITVMFRRKAVLAAGNYRRAPGMEDYDLWVRMLLNGSTLANLDEVLGKARIDETYGRRGGSKLASEELRLQYSFFRSGFVGVPTFVRNVMTRVPVRLAPARLRGAVISRFTREPATQSWVAADGDWEETRAPDASS